MTARRIAVVSAGLSRPSSTRLLADRLAQASVAALASRGVEGRVDVVELREHAHELTDNLLTGFATGALEQVKETVGAADGVIAVSPIFSTSYNGLFKTFFDVLDEGALAGTPVLLGATAGTARHSLSLEYALRPLFTYLKAVVTPTAVFAASEDWGSAGQADGQARTHAGLAARIDRAAGEFAALVARHEPHTAPDPFAGVTPFEQMLEHG